VLVGEDGWYSWSDRSVAVDGHPERRSAAAYGPIASDEAAKPRRVGVLTGPLARFCHD
jgi:hypothetical protein